MQIDSHTMLALSLSHSLALARSLSLSLPPSFSLSSSRARSLSVTHTHTASDGGPWSVGAVCAQGAGLGCCGRLAGYGGSGVGVRAGGVVVRRRCH